MTVTQLTLISLVLGVLVTAEAQTAPSLAVVAESRQMIWNAVAVDDADQVYVAGPRWTGSQGPSVALLDPSGDLHPYPDAAWNTQ
jgi:hypothetical protein